MLTKPVQLHRGWLLLAVSMLFVVLFSAETGTTQATTAVFINEMHYDNASTDTAEGIEIAGPAGTDLSNWQLVPYNGNGGAAYNTTSLSGSIPDLQNGCGALFFAIEGLQNGAPDGVALVDGSNNVIQFLSYEGSFTAVDGPANGMTSTDIGVAETTSTPVGHSLQLGGAGSSYEDFSWASPAASTYNAVNASQTFTCDGSGTGNDHVIINEVDADTPSTDVAEFIELYDGGVGATALDGLVIVFLQRQ